jgi:hypothetical protein
MSLSELIKLISQLPHEEILVFLYFTIKSTFFYKILRFKGSRKVAPLVSVILGLFSVLIDHYLQGDYLWHLNLYFIKGVIRLPPFYLIYIASDLVSSVCLTLYIRASKLPEFRVLAYEIGRLILLPVIFTTMTTTFWQRSYSDSLITNFNDLQCLKCHLERGLAKYYFERGDFPTTETALYEAVQLKKNPINNTDLVIQVDGEKFMGINDAMGNELISLLDFAGIGIYKNSPEDFFDILELSCKHLCPDKGGV